MPAAPFSSPFPALYLYPLNDSFIPKHIALPPGTRVKIGRQTNAKTTPGERNGYFDSKVLSRQHAEVWEEGGKIFIKDVKSSNGTFINGERLSPEALESDPFELKSDDIVEFGIDIVGEDNKTIIHHKVAARVTCVFTEQDVQMAARAEQHQMQHLQHYSSPGSSISSPSGSTAALLNGGGPGAGANGTASSSFNFAPNQQQRRPQINHSNLAGMGGMGGSMRPPGKSGLTFDHILTRLQGELQKSRETGAELHSLTGAMHDIHDTLGGGLPPPAPPYPHSLPPVRPPLPLGPTQQDAAAVSGPDTHDHDPSLDAGPARPSNDLLVELQSQLRDTQSSLAEHVDKIRMLESALKEQDDIRLEVRVLREMMTVARRRDLADSRRVNVDKHFRLLDVDLREGFDAEDDEEGTSEDDDGMSISTAVPHELERVDEEDEEQVQSSDESSKLHGIQDDRPDDAGEEHRDDEDDKEHQAEQEERRRRRDELGRPRTPEPNSLGIGELFDSRPRAKTIRSPTSPHHLNGVSLSVVEDLTSRLASLSSQLESALELSTTLQAQHTSAQSIISTLESKVEALEGLVTAALDGQSRSKEQLPSVVSNQTSLEPVTSMILEWKKSVEGQWSNVQEEWSQERERLSRVREEFESKTRLVDSGLEKIDHLHRLANISAGTPVYANGEASRHHGGLATPPSPRSLSSDSNRPRKRRSSSARGRSSSTNPKGVSPEAENANDSFKGEVSISRGFSADKDRYGVRSLATPEPTVRTLPSSYSMPLSPAGDSSLAAKHGDGPAQPVNMQTAIGVLVLSVAAAAVVWRVKPE